MGYASSMRRAVRVGLVVLGAATAVYGAASLTGGWLGTPPWEDPRPVLPRPRTNAEIARARQESDRIWKDVGSNWASGVPLPDDTPAAHKPSALGGSTADQPDAHTAKYVRPWWHKWSGLSLCEVGVVALSIGAWPRRRRSATCSCPCTCKR